MNFDLTEEQELLQNMVERFCLDQYSQNEHWENKNTPSGYSQKNWETLAELGLFAVPFSEDNGGLGADRTDIMCVMKSLGHAIAVEPILSQIIHAGMAFEALATPEQIETYLPHIITGKTATAIAHIESGARFNLSHITTRRVGDKLTGEKSFVVASPDCNVYVVSAQDSETGQVTFNLVMADADGLTRRDYRLADGSVTCILTFKNVISEPMSGTLDDFLDTLNIVKVAICAEMLGVMERLFEDTLEHVKTRQQFGQPLGNFQVIQHRMSDLYTALDLSRSHLYRILTNDPESKTFARDISCAKAFISDQAVYVAEDCVQLHGGMGTTDELIIGCGLKRILVLSNLFGDSRAEKRRALAA